MTRDPRVIIYAASLIVSALIGAGTAVLIWQRRKSRGAKPLAFMMLAVVIWSFTSAFEAVAITIPEKLFWSNR